MEDTPHIIDQWLNGIRIAQIGHLRTSARFKKLHKMLGIPVTIITVIVGTSIFSTLSSAQNQNILIMVGTISVLAAILSGLQTFLNYGELAAQHKLAGVRYGKLRRLLEENKALSITDSDLKPFLDHVRTEWDEIEEASPTIPQRYHDTAFRIVRPEQSKKRKELEEI